MLPVLTYLLMTRAGHSSSLVRPDAAPDKPSKFASPFPLDVKSVCSSAGLRWLVLLLLLRPSLGVCPHCKDTIAGCAGGINCPTITDLVTNAAIFADRTLGVTPKVSACLPSEVAAHFTRPVCDAIVGLACGPAEGAVLDFGAEPYANSAQAVVRAAVYGHCSVTEAAAELARRLEAAETAVQVQKIAGAIDALKIAGDSVASIASSATISLSSR